ncbi:uncharacterized protein LOC128986447 [Macrosteles quadrilineatus]|uniref:uncharacterized protein LOC128986447 n=1 Tax=Macrosteles quadrilineatus TaxID=74068 RepID=UPI0023E2E276|nr:uncharacterized protein LOC128986447 [Macrosteles quadrilineatus]
MKCFDFNSNVHNNKEEGVEFLIDRPVVPFFYKLYGRLRPNTTFIIQGVVDDNATRFQVDLTAGQGEKSDIVFHFNPRLNQLYTARNSRFSGAWGTEEGASQTKFPFRCGQPFLVEICTTDVKYLVAVDGLHYCSYKHRAPVASVVGLRVTGGVRLSQVLVSSTSYYPSLLPQLLLLPESKSSPSTNNQSISVVYNLTSQLQAQSSIIVQGVVNDNASRFEVDFLVASTEDEDKPDIGFHFNPRFDQKYTARNTRLADTWGKEEGSDHERFPFRRGQPFYLEIYITAAKFLVAVDGQHYITYRHRAPLKTLSKIHIHGGVTLTNVHFQNSPKYPSPLPQFLSGDQDEEVVEAGEFSTSSGLQVPFIHEFKSRLLPQSTFILQGSVDSHATRFNIDFIIGDEDQPDIAFHFNPRLDEYVVTRNSRFNECWGEEERGSEQKFPFRCGQPFFLEIFLSESKFMVAVDGVHYCSFTYRTHLASITRVCVQGGVSLSQVALHTSATYPTPMPEYLPCPDLQPVVLYSASDYEPKPEPFHHKLASSFNTQSSLIIQGEVMDNGIRFAVNFSVDRGASQDFAFHFNPRLLQGYTARNCKFGGTWGTEEGNVKEKFPFRNGFPFYMEIYFSNSKFMVAVDGVHYCSFDYRTPLATVTSVQVEGAVTVRKMLVHPTANYPSAVLEFIPEPENNLSLHAFRTNSISSISSMVPYFHELRSSLHPQSSVFVQGVVDCRTTRLEINFMMGRGEKADIAFHFNPRLDQHYTARNTRLEGSWGVEESNSFQCFPFVRGQPFYVEIFLTHSEYLVAVNGVHYCSYAYRTQLGNVTCVEVCGVKDTQVDVRPVVSYPSSPPTEIVKCLYKIKLADVGDTGLSCQITPLFAALPKKLVKKSKIEILGKVKLLPHSFYVNLQEGSDHWPHPLVPFHLSTRFMYPDRKVIANTWAREKWHSEEKSSYKFPFTPGQTFSLTISCEDDRYMVHMDGHVLLVYRHRVPYKSVDTLMIHGDIFIYNVNYVQS